MSYLLEYLSGVGAEKQATALTDRAIAHVPLDDTIGVARLLQSLWEAGAQDQVTALADRAIPRVSLDDPGAVAALLAQPADGARAGPDHRAAGPRSCRPRLPR